MTPDHDTIAAPATAPGGAITVIRVSGSDAMRIADRIFRGRRPLASAQGYTVHYGRIVENMPGTPAAGYPSKSPSCRVVDEVLATVFRAPHSYTGEDSVEISCHGSAYIVSETLRLLVAAGARLAQPGEFTVRAYLNGKMDLSQAEAVADLIASSSRAAHTLAVNQLRGGYSSALEALRGRLLDLVSLLELELDFSEEEVEFADRTDLRHTLERIAAEVEAMRESFALGNAVKEGVAVAFVGAPNVGKSTLLNRLLNEERALVSDIAGTTRDVIEERAAIDGVLFRFLDTAGIRSTDDTLEKMGIERTLKSISQAQIVIRLLDAASLRNPETGCENPESISNGIGSDGQNTGKPGSDSQSIHPPFPGPDSPSNTEPANDGPDVQTADSEITDVETDAASFPLRNDQRLLVVVNKLDTHPDIRLPEGVIGISAKTGEGIDRLRLALRTAVDTEALYHGDAVVSSSRHYEALTAAGEALSNALESLRNGLPTDLLSEEIRPVIRHLGAITGRGTITPDEVLRNIFSKFCIGK